MLFVVSVRIVLQAGCATNHKQFKDKVQKRNGINLFFLDGVTVRVPKRFKTQQPNIVS